MAKGKWNIKKLIRAMKKIVASLILLVLFITVAPLNAKKCIIKTGRADIAWGVVYKFIDYNCDDIWDIMQEIKMTSEGWVYTGNQWDVPAHLKSIELPEIVR